MNKSLDLVTLDLRCRCRACHIEVIVTADSLPLAMDICHCTTCRHLSGQLAMTVGRLPKDAKLQVQSGSSQIRGYRTSINGPQHSFCGQCGTGLYEEGGIALSLNTGSLGEIEKGGKPVLKARNHIFVADTNDGGLRDMICSLSSWEGWQNKSRQLEAGTLYGKVTDQSSRRNDGASQSRDSDRLECYCQCKGINFHITRPHATSHKAIMKEHLDLLVPWYADRSERENYDNAPFWLCGPKQDKYLAGLCVCSDCRTASGFEVQPWAFVPIANIEMPNRGTLVRYQSSDRSWRDFCGRCGANVFFGMTKTEGVRECWDISVGLMAANGARAEEWLEWWTRRVSYEDKAVNKPFVEVLGRDIRHWATTK